MNEPNKFAEEFTKILEETVDLIEPFNQLMRDFKTADTEEEVARIHDSMDANTQQLRELREKRKELEEKHGLSSEEDNE